MRILLVEGITDVNLVRYIYSQMSEENSFDDFVKKGNINPKIVTFENQRNPSLKIINLNGQDKLDKALENIILPMERKIKKIGIISDADNNFDLSKEIVIKAIENSLINKDKFMCFLTPNDKDVGNLETLLLSSLDKENLPQLQCFKEYKECLNNSIENIEKRAIDKHEVEAYIKFSEKPRNRNQAQFSFVDEKGDTGLWDLSKKEFEPIIAFVELCFKNNKEQKCKKKP
ncbi:hypothetical protein MNB_SV-13-2048 [hydrothermal vent metagenome]|uniref:DUF4276 family protein n=1 Tax=hydrothermal vent metagenome TaxID=652676 RepID=A0A1W1CYX4_9ZZZZ